MRATATCLLAFALGCGKPTPTPNAPGAPEPTDRERLQGTWGVVWMDSGNGANEAELKAKLKDFDVTEEELARELDEVRQGRITFKDDRMNFSIGDGRFECTFALDETQNPKVMKLTLVDGANGPKTGEWLYKFEGDSLIVAYTEKGGARPPGFAARRHESPALRKPGVLAVFVLTLKKTDVPPKLVPGRSPSTIQK